MNNKYRNNNSKKTTHTMKLFITGATGYIGGEVLHQFLQKLPHFWVTALHRLPEEAKLLKDSYGDRVHPIFGSLDNSGTLEREAREADIIINAACYNHAPSVEVFKKVLSERRTKALFIQISGTGILVDSTEPDGYRPDKVYSDVDDIDEINSLPDSQPHRPAEKVALSIEDSNPEFVKTAVVCPPLIFGIGQGCGNKLSVQIPWLLRAVVEVGYNFTVYDGMTRWDHAHIYDVGTLFMAIVEKYLQGEPFRSGHAGYYFVEDGSDFYWKDLAAKVSDSLYSRGLIRSREIKKLNPAQVREIFHLPAMYWGSNCRSKADAGKLLGWRPIKSDDAHFWADVDESLDYMVSRGIL